MLAVPDQVALELLHPFRPRDIARKQGFLVTKHCRHRHRLSGVCTCAHYPRGAERDVGGTGDAAGEKQVLDIAAVKGAIWDLKHTARVPLVTARAFAINALSGM